MIAVNIQIFRKYSENICPQIDK